MPTQGVRNTEPDDAPTGLMGLEFVEGLHVVGNDAASFMGGICHRAGLKLGSALVFGHLAACHFSGAGSAHDA
jgi:hypothetical protein